ncbi:MAG: zf-HC2 domain-containing protein [Clostridia bacterium]|nr:zf-HC2 domain-containing protein [Clostridia bacterium]
MIDDKDNLTVLDCDRVREDISAYLDGELEANDAEKIRNHIESCNDCRELLEHFSDISLCVRQTVDIPDDLHLKIMESVNVQKAKEKISISSRMRKIGLWCGAGVAAVLCLAVINSPMFKTSMDFSAENANGKSMSYDISGGAEFDKDDGNLYATEEQVAEIENSDASNFYVSKDDKSLEDDFMSKIQCQEEAIDVPADEAETAASVNCEAYCYTSKTDCQSIVLYSKDDLSKCFFLYKRGTLVRLPK